MIDLRSDTVTQPTEPMRQAMAAAEVGDDVFGEDPTVLALEQRIAELLGKEAAVFMPSGTMTNQVALRTHTQAGDEVILEAEAHTYFYEAGGAAALSGVTCRLIPGRRGLFTAGQLRGVLRPADVHFPTTRLVCIENTHNRGGGTVWPVEQVAEVCAAAHQAGLKTHMDGARLWNASVASGAGEAEYARHFDSVSVCFSKGLGAPVGSALAGSEAFIRRARHIRKMYGGGMRQAGIIAAGALYALQNHRKRLVEDHANARALGEAIAEVPGVEIDVSAIETNIVYFRTPEQPAAELAARLADEGVAVLPIVPDLIRAVTSLAVTSEDVRAAGGIIREAVRS